MWGVMTRLRHRLTHQCRRANAAIEPGVIAHLDNGRNAAPLLADELRVGTVELHLARRIRAVAKLVFQPEDLNRVALALRRPARHQKATQAFRRLCEDKKDVAHWRRHEPFVAM